MNQPTNLNQTCNQPPTIKQPPTNHPKKQPTNQTSNQPPAQHQSIKQTTNQPTNHQPTNHQPNKQPKKQVINQPNTNQANNQSTTNQKSNPPTTKDISHKPNSNQTTLTSFHHQHHFATDIISTLSSRHQLDIVPTSLRASRAMRASRHLAIDNVLTTSRVIIESHRQEPSSGVIDVILPSNQPAQ